MASTLAYILAAIFFVLQAFLVVFHQLMSRLVTPCHYPGELCNMWSLNASKMAHNRTFLYHPVSRLVTPCPSLLLLVTISCICSQYLPYILRVSL